MKYYARSREDNDNPESWQELSNHLDGVARLAEQFAGAFASSEWGGLAGRWHDLGKYQVEFQQKLRGERKSVEHSGVGAALAFQKDREFGLPLSFAIAAHHTGLADLHATDPDLPTPLIERVYANEPLLKRLPSDVLANEQNCSIPSLPPYLKSSGRSEDPASLKRRGEFWTRFLFSTLVDADRLDSEAYANPQRAFFRGSFPTMAELCKNIDRFIEEKIQGIPVEARGSIVNHSRAGVLKSCRCAAAMNPGVFSLMVPTGGGKTLSAMSFALRHAVNHGHRRVIVVIPYTSIIEQNAEEYRRALGQENVIEHHSNIDPVRERIRSGEEGALRRDLACENWNAPVIVTTTVQFFESLFSNRPSQCRKLHNIAKSVIILDEVQTLPPQFLLSIVDALNELVENYGCSVVLSTATPPALAARPHFESGLKDCRSIIADPAGLARRLKRVVYRWPDNDAEPRTWAGLATELRQYLQVLAVVHRRQDARDLAQLLQEALPDQYVYHLSALMCPAHRSDVLARIRGALAAGNQCRVVSTQLVEAGVDIDFPVVYRALGGLDSIVQAAGRCNREGKRKSGEVVVFRAPTPPPRGTSRRALETTQAILREGDNTIDCDDPAIFERYFRMLYHVENLDAAGIQALRQEFNFARVGRNFRLIEDGFTRCIVVPYGEAEARLDDLRRIGPNRATLRALQPFVVSVYAKAFEKMLLAGALEQAADGIYAVTVPFRKYYNLRFGLTSGDEIYADPEVLHV